MGDDVVRAIFPVPSTPQEVSPYGSPESSFPIERTLSLQRSHIEQLTFNYKVTDYGRASSIYKANTPGLTQLSHQFW